MDSYKGADVVDLTKKRCGSCHRHRARMNFYKRSRSHDGLAFKCKPCDRAANRHWKADNEQRHRVQQADYRERNKDAKAAQDAAYYAAKGEAIRQRMVDYYAANRELVLARNERWRRANPDAWKALADRRKARLHDAWVEDVDRSVVWKRDRGLCRLCQQPADPECWHLEHFTPLARGGEHSYANTGVSHPQCNLQKGVKTLNEYLAHESGVI